MAEGWSGIKENLGKFVPERNAFGYAAAACGITGIDASAPCYEEFRAYLVDWYFSGAWVRVSAGE